MPLSRFGMALVVLTASSISLGIGCSSEPAQVDTAVVSPDPAVKPAPAPSPAPEATPSATPAPGPDGATTPSPATTSPSTPPQAEPTKP